MTGLPSSKINFQNATLLEAKTHLDEVLKTDFSFENVLKDMMAVSD